MFGLKGLGHISLGHNSFYNKAYSILCFGSLMLFDFGRELEIPMYLKHKK